MPLSTLLCTAYWTSCHYCCHISLIHWQKLPTEHYSMHIVIHVNLNTPLVILWAAILIICMNDLVIAWYITWFKPSHDSKHCLRGGWYRHKTLTLKMTVCVMALSLPLLIVIGTLLWPRILCHSIDYNRLRLLIRSLTLTLDPFDIEGVGLNDWYRVVMISYIKNS